MTFISNTGLTAAQLNTFVRDNFNETAPARALSAGNWFVSDGINSVKERRITSAEFLSSESTFSTDFVDLTHSVAVTLITGTQAIVHITCEVSAKVGFGGSGINIAYVGYAITGATQLAASKDRALKLGGANSGSTSVFRTTYTYWQTGLTAGSNTFTLKFANEVDTTSSPSTFVGRQLVVMAV
jgi:hypothetical protein